VNENVAESHDLAEIGNLGRERRVEAGELTQSLAGNLELALDRRAQDDITVEICESFACVMAAIAFAASRASQRRLLGSRFKDRLPRALDARFQIGVAHRARLDEIDVAIP